MPPAVRRFVLSRSPNRLGTTINIDPGTRRILRDCQLGATLARSHAPHYRVALATVEEAPAMQEKLMCVPALLLAAVASAQRAYPSAASHAGSSWTTFADPAEQAFTLSMPTGWKIIGGTYRW